MSHRPFVLTASLLLLLAGSFDAAAQEGGAAPPAAPQAAGEKIQLAVRSEKGARLGFEMSMDMQQTMNMGGMEVPTELGLNQTWVETCKDVDAAGVATLHTQFVRVHGNFSNPMMGEFPFDSDKADEGGAADEGNPMAAMGAQLTKAFTQMATMEIESKVGADGTTISAKMLTGDAAMQQGAEDMSKQMGGLGKLPKDPVGVGDSWTNETTVSAGMGMKLLTKVKNTVQSIDADAVTVKQEAEISKLPADASASDDPQQAAMAQMMANMTLSGGEMKGTARVSRKDGKVLGSESTMKFKLADESGGTGMALEQTMKMKLTRLDKIPERAKKAEPKPAEPKPAEHPGEHPMGPGAK